MRLLVELSVRNTRRNLRRTTLTALTIVLGTALLTLAFSWERGVFGEIQRTAAALMGHVRITDVDYARKEDLLPLYENVDSESLVPIARQHADVVDVHPRIVTGVVVTVGEQLGDIFAVAVGAPEAWYRDWLRIEGDIDGRMLARDGELLLGAAVAARTGAELGDEVVLVGQTQDGSISPVKVTVVGIVRSGAGVLDQQVYLSLDAMRALTDVAGATEVLVYGVDRYAADQLATVLEPSFPGLAVEAWSERPPWASYLVQNRVVRIGLCVVLVLTSSLGIWNTMSMSVLERTPELGVMRAMGLNRSEAMSMVVIEAVIIGTLGGLVGVALGSALGLWLEVHGVTFGDVSNTEVPMRTTMYGDLTPQIAVFSFALAWAMAVLGSLPAALRAAAVEPIVAMRSRS